MRIKKAIFLIYIFLLIALLVFSYGFIDASFPLKIYQPFSTFATTKRGFTTIIYSILMVMLFTIYGLVLWMVKNKRLEIKDILRLIVVTVVILLFSFPAFSYDIFNYIATSKVTFFYKENPYIIMPIEIPNEPMLSFTHAANKIALYGPVWIILTAIPYFLGIGNILITVFTFKFFIILFYLGLVWLIWQMSNKNTWSLAFFALNPLVVIETLVSSHNDVVMMFFALFAFYFLKKKKLLISAVCLILSLFIKYATLFLIPVYLYSVYVVYRDKKIEWQKIWKWAAISMYIIFFSSPLREEIYSWYFIWILSFVALFDKLSYLSIVSLAFSFGLPFRVAPFFYTGSWIGITPMVKKLVTFIPPILVSLLYALKKKT